MRIRAESSGVYLGSDDAVFDEGDGKYPKSAKVVVWKLVGGQRGRFEATARWAEYAPPNIDDAAAFMWRKMSHGQLAKCAEALALRKAFPGQLAGLYASDEMAQDGRYLELPAQSMVDAGDAHGDMSGEDKPELVAASEEVAGSYTAKQILDKPALLPDADELLGGFTFRQILSTPPLVRELVALTGKKTQAVCKFLNGLVDLRKYTLDEIAQLMSIEEHVG
jgi:hypothetical protein